MSSARTLAFLDKLPAALDELERKWAQRAIAPDEVIDFTLKCLSRFQVTTPEREALSARLRKILNDASRARDASPAKLAEDVAAVARAWRAGEVDNYKDIFMECHALLGRAQPGSKPRRTLLAVLGEVIADARRAAATDPQVEAYLGSDWLDAGYWESVGEPDPVATPRVDRAGTPAAPPRARRGARDGEPPG